MTFNIEILNGINC